jgi:hypothetical protein
MLIDGSLVLLESLLWRLARSLAVAKMYDPCGAVEVSCIRWTRWLDSMRLHARVVGFAGDGETWIIHGSEESQMYMDIPFEFE